MENNVTIYALCEPNTGDIRYIGKTIQKVTNRYSSHISVSRHNTKKDYTHCWIKSLLNKGLKPELLILEENTTIDDEIFYISYLKSLGMRLTNHTIGGQQGTLGYTWKVKNKSKLGKKQRKPIVAIINNRKKKFKSVKHCALYFNTSNNSIVKCLKSKRSYKGIIIYYEKENNKSDIVYKIPMKTKIFCIINNNKVVYSNAKEASKQLNISYSGIMKCLKGKLIHIKNLKFDYII